MTEMKREAMWPPLTRQLSEARSLPDLQAKQEHHQMCGREAAWARKESSMGCAVGYVIPILLSVPIAIHGVFCSILISVQILPDTW